MSWNGLVISAFARASKILRAEPNGTKHNFPDVNSDVRDWFFSPASLKHRLA